MSSGKNTDNINSFCVIFDVDGTMVDNAAYHQKAWIELGRLYDLPITPEYYKNNIHARSNARIVKTLYKSDSVDTELTQSIERDKEGIYRKLYRPVLEEIPGLTKLIKELKQNSVPCAVASNSPKENVDMVIDELDIRKYIDLVIDCN